MPRAGRRATAGRPRRALARARAGTRAPRRVCLDERGVAPRTQASEIAQRRLEQLDSLGVAPGADRVAAEQGGGKGAAPLVARAPPDANGLAASLLRLRPAALVGEHLADVAVAEAPRSTSPARALASAALAVERDRLVPAARAVGEAAHVVEHRRLAVDRAVPPEDLQRAVENARLLGARPDSTSAQSRIWQAWPSAPAPRRPPRRRRSPRARARSPLPMRPWRWRTARASRRGASAARPRAGVVESVERAQRAPRPADGAGTIRPARSAMRACSQQQPAGAHRVVARRDGGRRVSAWSRVASSPVRSVGVGRATPRRRRAPRTARRSGAPPRARDGRAAPRPRTRRARCARSAASRA